MHHPATKIKFCGITRPEDADAAVAAGAWALGLIQWPGSPRRCPLAEGLEIAATHRRHTQVVGVFVNPTLDHVVRVADEIGLTMLQFHGEEGPSFCAEAGRRTGCRVIKAARVRSGADIQALAAFHTDFHLLDSYVPGARGGTGETFAWELVRDHDRSAPRGPAPVPVILSGGLDPDNVAEAISVAHPYAVDVASGVESAPGIKDHAALQAFAAAVIGGVATDEAGPTAGVAGDDAGPTVPTDAEETGVEAA